MLWNRLSLFLVAVGLVCVATQASAAIVAEYRFENDLTSEANSPALNATSGTTAGFSTDVPGAFILDGVGGPAVANAVANAASYNNGTGSGSAVSDAGGIINDDVNTGGFTVEAFIKIDSAGSSAFDLIFGNLNPAGSSGWLLGINNAGQLRFSAPQANNGSLNSSTSALALAEDVWVHVAAVGTYTERTEPSPGAGGGFVDFTDVQLYIDYAASGTATRFFGANASEVAGVSGPIFVTSAADYTIGAGNAFDGLIDEVRFSDTALVTDDLLRASAIPEPTSMVLLGMGAFLVMFRRRGVC